MVNFDVKKLRKQYKLIRSWSCLKARPRPRPVVKTKTKTKTVSVKTKTKTGRFGFETTRDQDHGLEDNNTAFTYLLTTFFAVYVFY